MSGRDFKAEIARARLSVYRVAGEAGINNTRLSRLLNEREPMTDRDESRIRAAIERLAGSASAPC